MTRANLARRVRTIEHPTPRRILVAALFPAVAVALGLWVFSSAWLALGLYQLGLVLGHLVRGRARTPLVRLWMGGGGASLGLGLLMGVSGGGLFLAVAPWLSLPSDLGDRMAALGLGGWRWPVFMAYHVLVNASLEELVWRGDLAHPSPRPQAVDGAFALYHLVVIAPFVAPGWLPVAFAVVGGAGWIWRRLSQRAAGLRPALLSHMAADASILLSVHVLVFS